MPVVAPMPVVTCVAPVIGVPLMTRVLRRVFVARVLAVPLMTRVIVVRVCRVRFVLHC